MKSVYKPHYYCYFPRYYCWYHYCYRSEWHLHRLKEEIELKFVTNCHFTMRSNAYAIVKQITFIIGIFITKIEHLFGAW